MAVLARTALLLATALAVCFALMQVGGRLLFAHLDRFEDRVNAYLEKSGAAIGGLEGSWRYLNPSVSAATLSFAGGDLQELTVELDVPESLWRNRLVARRLHVRSARLRFVPTDSGWRFDGKPGDMELEDFFRHSDELELAGRIEFAGHSSTGTLYAQVAATNRGNRHRWRAMIMPESATGRLLVEEIPPPGNPHTNDCDCVLIDLDLTDLRGARPVGHAQVLGDSVLLSGDLARALAVPELLLGIEARWSGDDSRAAFVADMRASVGTTKPAHVSAGVVARATGDDAAYHGIASMRATAGDASLALQRLGVRADAQGVGLWFANIDVADLNGWLANASATHGHWFEGVAATGTVEWARAHVGARGLAYEARLHGISMSNYRGVPELANGCGHLRGHRRSMRIDFRCEAMRLGLPRYFEDSWDYDAASGAVTLWFEPGYFGVTGEVELALGGAALRGGFGLTRPRDPFEGRFAFLGLADGVDVGFIQRHVPQELDGDLKRWLQSSLKAGSLNAASAVYHGHTQTRPGLPNRRFEIAGVLADGEIDYHAQWPPAEALQGSITITGEEARARVVEGVLFGAQVRDTDIRVPVTGGYVDIAMHAQAGVTSVLEFVRNTPLADELDFVDESWRGAGALGIEGSLRIPINDEFNAVDLDLAFDLQDASLDLVDLRLHFSDLTGSTRFQSPHRLHAQAVAGSLFGFPVHISVTASEQANVVDLRGRGAVADIYRVLDTPELPMAAGVFGFDARLWAFFDASRALELSISSDMLGVAVSLPPPLHKAGGEERRFDIDLVFDDDQIRGDVRGQTFTGWFHASNGVLARGAIGIGVPPAAPEFSSSEIRLSGRLGTIRLQGDASGLLPEAVQWRLDDLWLESVGVGEIELTDVVLNGVAGMDQAAIGIDSNEARGTLVLNGEDPLLIALDEIRLSPAESDGDPLDVSVFEHVPAADVTIGSIMVGGDDYGAWTFGIRPNDGVIRLAGLVGDIKGIRIQASDDFVWAAETDISHFEGQLAAGDLARVLPQWGYAPNVESTRVDIQAVVRWPGSPLNYELGDLSGSVQVAIDAGRFVDIDHGAGANILALLNFAKVARRLRLDFSDVVDRGVDFDRVRANGELDAGVLSFTEPMEIHGPGSDFRINGTVDLGDGTLNNEMVVTLPLSSSLPWYAAWLAATEPVTAVGVMVGREIFKEQLRTLSSAKYRITGTIEEPNPEFVDIFRSDMEHPGEAE